MSASWRISRMKFYETEEKKSLPKIWAWHHCWSLSSLIFFPMNEKLLIWREVEKSKKEHFSDETHGTTRLVRRALASAAAEKSLTARASHLIVCRCFALFFFGRSRPIDTRINYNPNLWAKKHRQARNLPQIIDQQQPKLSYAWKFLNATRRGQKREIERHTTGRRIIYEIKFIILRSAEAAARLSETLSARIYVHSILRRVWFQLVGRRRRRRHQCRSRRVINKQKKRAAPSRRRGRKKN